MGMMSAGARLRALLNEPGIVIAPGASDALTALLIREAGFKAVYCTGGGISRGRGLPDIGYTTLTEMAERVRNMVEVCTLPVIADIDSGFGGVVNLARAVRTFEALGAAGLHVEDMETPRRTRQPAGNIIAAEVMARRIAAAISARSDPNLVLIARTDVLPHLGLDEAIDRGNRYADSGADMIYVEYIKTKLQMETIATRINAPKLISVNKGVNEMLPAQELAQMGYKLLTHPADAQLASIHAIRALLSHIKKHGSTAAFERMVSFPERDSVVGLAEAREFEEQYLP